jgi:hypothetical protein
MGFLDERCLHVGNLESLLRLWYGVLELCDAATSPFLLFLDSHTVHDAAFKRRFNNDLSSDKRLVFGPVVFGLVRIRCWRPISIAGGSTCRLENETAELSESGVCEARANTKLNDRTILVGGEHSSYLGCVNVNAHGVNPADGTVRVNCATDLHEFEQKLIALGLRPRRYARTSTDAPRDIETVLGWDRSRFQRSGQFAKRRFVYRETGSGYLWYVDEAHVGGSAHLEVFDGLGRHVGKADLNGNIIPHSAVRGRKLSR